MKTNVSLEGGEREGGMDGKREGLLPPPPLPPPSAFITTEELPEHITRQIEEEKEQERREKERQEWEKNLCKVHSSTSILVRTLLSILLRLVSILTELVYRLDVY